MNAIGLKCPSSEKRETGQTELNTRVSFLERGSWIKKAKPRDEVESFSLETSGKGAAFTHACPTPTMLV